MSDLGPIRLGLAGLSGYAQQICDRVLKEAEAQHPAAHLTAIYDRDVSRISPQALNLLQQRGVIIVSSFEELLAQDLDAVWLPLPIHLHRSFTEQALSAGKSVLCEKPAAGAVQDVDAMIAARDRSQLICAIGYQDLFQPVVHELKRRLVRGEFGVILSASVIGCWPRGQTYYTRNNWAGAIQRDGQWVLDSPAQNAFAHYIHLAQYLLGASEHQSATPREVEAELYRANPIESYDTCSLRMTFDGGAHLLVGLTHACATPVEPEVILRTQTARICFRPGLRVEIHAKNVSEIIPLIPDRFTRILNAMQSWIYLGPQAACGGTLELARAHTVAMNAVSEAAIITNVPNDQIDTLSDPLGKPLRAIRGIENALQTSIRQGRMLHEMKIVPWSVPAGDFTLEDYRIFKGPKQAGSAT